MKKRILLIVTAIILAAGVAAVWLLDILHWEKLDLEKLRNFQQATILYDSTDAEMAVLSGAQHRRVIPLADIPQHVQQAFLAAEDARFYSHSGIDPWRIGGALLANLKSGDYAQGASTITQQLIKLTHLNGQKTLARKAQEIWLALQLERQMSKNEILEAYLNTVYFGGANSGIGAYGIEAAANVFFQKSAEDLTLAEGALLAAVIKSPSGYSPAEHPEKALERRNAILSNMAEYSFIDSETSLAAQQEPLGLNVADRQNQTFGWYVDAALTEAETILQISADDILSGGYRIYTALLPQSQLAAEALFENGVNFPDAAPDGTPVQSALVALDANTGAITALIGGRTYGVRRGLNRATQIARQPGSAIKPVSTYAAAIDGAGYLPSSILTDEQRVFGENYFPGNAGGNYYGKVTMREALSRSLNVATVDLADEIGISAVRLYARRLGLPLDESDQNLALALGAMTYGVSPLSLANAYLPLANDGEYLRAHCIRRIEYSNGTVVYQHPSDSTRVLREESACLLTSMLRTAASQGSAKALSAAGIPIAGKTGTVEMANSEGNRDIWTVAYTPSSVVCVWMGFDEPDASHVIANGTGGSSYPARLIAKYFSDTVTASSVENFPIPAGLAAVLIDKKALDELHHPMLATEITPAEYRISEIFPTNRIPSEISPYWILPEKIEDLSVRQSDSGKPEILFTARDINAEYVLMRTVAEEHRAIAVLEGDPGTQIAYIDESAPDNGNITYSIVPRHKLLYEMGRLAMGEESESVEFHVQKRWGFLR